MPLLLLLLIAVLSGLAAAFLTRLYPHRKAAPPVVEVAARPGGMPPARRGRRGARRAPRPGEGHGLALTLALAAVIVGGVVLAVLAVVVRSTDVLAGVDSSVAEWGHRHATGWSHEGLTLVTDLGETWMVIVVAVAVAAVELARTRNRWVAPFLLAVIVGDKVLTETIKQLVDRARPALEPVAATLDAVVPQRPHLHRRRCRGRPLRWSPAAGGGPVPGRHSPAPRSASRSRSRPAACCSTSTG